LLSILDEVIALMSEKRKVIIISDKKEGFELEREEFSKEGAELIIRSCKNEAELLAAVKDAYVIIITDVKINKRVIDSLSQCKLVIRYGVGVDNIDIREASEKGIYVCNAPTYGTYDVAEHAVVLLLCCSRKVRLWDGTLRKGRWKPANLGPDERLKDKTIGLVGFGRIAQCVCERVVAFGLKPIVFDPYVADDVVAKYGVTRVNFDDLLAASSYITIHSPLTEETRHLFNMNAFRKMKNTAIIINTSRGGLINEPDLVRALQTGEIAGAGLDVFENEPLPMDSELLKLENVVLTPHIAWYTKEAIRDRHREVTNDVVRVLRSLKPVNLVN
jgi:D-3-phosphoglycerate dehydrogenase